MTHSTVTKEGQTTIPGKIRKALQIRPGDTLEYVAEGDHATWARSTAEKRALTLAHNS